MDPDDLDLGLEGLGDDGDAGSSDSGDGSGAPPASGDAPAGKDESKRINDLMSKWQAAEARAEAAERKLKTGDGQAKPRKGEIPPEVQAWMTAAKDAARDRYYNSDPRFAQYELEPSLFDGETPDDMASNAKRFKSLIDSIEAKARDRVLREHGVNPDLSSGRPVPDLDIGAMSDADFEKLVAGVKSSRF